VPDAALRRYDGQALQRLHEGRGADVAIEFGDDSKRDAPLLKLTGLLG